MNKSQVVNTFVSFDIETSGTIPDVNEILEISAVRFKNGEIVGRYTSLVKNTKPIPEAASKVNGIYEHMLADAPSIEEALPKFSEFCGDDIMVAHNAPFDTAFVSKSCQKHEISGPKGVVVCSLAMSRKVFPGHINYKLSTLLDLLKISSGTLHRAEADSVGCGMIMLEIMKRVGSGREVLVEQLINLTGKEITFPQIKKEPKQMGLF